MWTPNPLTVLHDKICRSMESSALLSSRIKPGNWKKYNTVKSSKLKESVTPGDVPEIEVLPDGFVGNLTASSSSSLLDWQLEIIASTGSYSHSTQMAQIQWALLMAMRRFRLTEIDALSYLGTRFVKSVKLIDAQEGLSEFNANRALQGWTSLIRLEFKLSLGFNLFDEGSQPSNLLLVSPNFETPEDWQPSDWQYSEGLIYAKQGAGAIRTKDLFNVGQEYTLHVYIRAGSVTILGNELNQHGVHSITFTAVHTFVEVVPTDETEIGFFGVV